MTEQRGLETFYGTVQEKPEVCTIPCRPVRQEVYDAATDEIIDVEYIPPHREVRRFWVAAPLDDDGIDIQPLACVDWLGFSALLREGDRVQVWGYPRMRVQEGIYERRAFPEIVVKHLELDRSPVREKPLP